MDMDTFVQTYNDTDNLPPAPDGWEWEYAWDDDWYLKKPWVRPILFKPNGYWEQIGGWNFGKMNTRVESFCVVIHKIKREAYL
jgi:hypothetical protein